MHRSPLRPAVPGLFVLGLAVVVALSSGLVRADTPTPTVSALAPLSPPNTASFDISFVKNDIAAYILADRANNAIDLVDAKTPAFTGYIGQNGFVGVHAGRGLSGPNGALIDTNNHVWVGDGPAADCSTAACRCSATDTTSMVKEYTLAVSSGATGRLACLPTGGKFRADELAFDPRDDLLLVANDFDGFLSLISTTGTPAIVDQFFYADNDLGKPASARRLATAGGGIEQPVWDPQQGFFYQAIPQGSTVGRVDVFNPKAGKLVLLRSITVPDCNGGPSGLALDSAAELLGACGNGAALINANSGAVTMLTGPGTAPADEIWFDAGSNAWYLGIFTFPFSVPGKLGVVSAAPGHASQVIACAVGGCGHSVAAYTASSSHSLIFDPNQGGVGISVFNATP